MKKIFGFIGMWLMAMTLCCSFMACSSDDGEEERSEGVNGAPGVNGDGKRLVSITTIYHEINSSMERRFEYDKHGRIVRDINDERTTTYEYGETKIIATTRNVFLGGSITRREYSLKNGRIVKSTTDYGTSVSNEEYEYDGNKLLNKGTLHMINSDIITWDGDNIATWGDNVYIYSNLESSIGWHDCYDISYEDEVLLNQGYFGARPRNLVATAGWRGGGIPDKYKYEVNDGYVTKKVTDNVTTEYVWE